MTLCTRALALATLLLVAQSFALAERPERPSTTATSFQRGTMSIVPNVLLIKLRPQTTFTAGERSIGVSSLDALFARIGVTEVRRLALRENASLRKSAVSGLHSTRIIRINYSANEHPDVLAREVAMDASVEYAEPYYEFPLSRTPNDPNLAQQWAVNVMKLKEAWDITTGDSTIVIGDVDTGVDWQHEDLALNIWTNPGEWGNAGELSNNGVDDDGNGKIDDWHGWDFLGNGTSQSPKPDNNPMDGALGHGTNTSGCAAARTDNGVGIAGSGYRAKILAIKASSDNSMGVGAGYEGILYAVQMGARIINCSWGGTGAFSQTLQDIIDDANAVGALVVGSSGNDPLDNDYIPHFPSSLNHVLNVGSVESSGAASTWCTYGTSVSTYSPGTGILTTRKGGGYTSPQGTSFSAPLAAGVAALVMAVHPDWTPDQVATQIRVTSDRFNTQNDSKRYGRINAYKAVSLNSTLSDIPGIRLKSSNVQIEGGGFRFTEPGQKARVSMTLENVLAPTSDQATATLAIDDPSLIADPLTTPLGVMATFDTRLLEFDVTLSNLPRTSEGYLPVRVRIDDGAYSDFVVVRIAIFLTDAWHTTLSFETPYFTSISPASTTAAWAAAHVGNQDAAFRTVNGGGSWSNASGSGFPTGKGVYCIFAPSSSNALVGTGPSSGAAEVFRSTNGGTNWTGVSVANITGFVNWIHMFDPSNGILQGDPRSNIWGLATTTDGGATWSALATPVTAAASEAGWNNSYACVGDTLWFGTNNSRVFRSTDRGVTWQSFTTPSKHSVDMSFADSRRGVIRFTSQQNQGGEDALAYTTDGGETWTRITTIQLANAAGVQMEPRGKRLWLIQGTSAFVSTDLGQTWTAQAVPGNFGTLTTTAIWANNLLTDVYAGGLDIFKYRSNLQPYSTTSTEAPAAGNFRIDNLYPNPVTGSGATLTFAVRDIADVRVELYDNLGRLLRRDLDARLAAGTHSVRIGTTGLTPGAYHVRVTVGGVVETRSLQILR